MRLLLDTHILLWGLNEPGRLSAPARAAMAAPGNELFISLASLWEIAIKARKGQLAIDDDLPHQIERNRDLTLLPILAEHVWGVRRLPRLHGDPFDQLLVVQAMQENMTLVTHDRKIGAYGVPIIAA